MKQISFKTVAVGKVSGVAGESRRFNAAFAPYYEEKRFGFINRKTLEYEFNLSSTKDYLETITKRFSGNEDLVEKIKTAQSQDRHFFHQAETIAGREKYISIIAGAEMDMHTFKRITAQLALDKHLWKWGISSDMVIEMNGAKAENFKVYQDGKLLKFGIWQKIKNFYTERKNPYEVIDTVMRFIPQVEALSQHLKAQEAQYKMIGLFSDIHTADKSEIDNFGEEKEAHLITLINQMISENIPLLINGDFFELWQSVFEHVAQSYPELFASMKKLMQVIMLPGNHDDEIINYEDMHDRVKKLFTDEETGKCNLIIVPHFVHSIGQIDFMMTHGDIADPMNNNTKFGRYVAKLGALAEKIRNNPQKGINDTEQVLEGGLRRFLFSDASIIEGEIINYFNHLMSMIKLYRFKHGDKITNEIERDLLLIYGHTHDMVKHVDSSSRLQSLLYQVIDQIGEISKTINVTYINSGGGSGENKDAELLMSKSAYRGNLKNNLETARKKAKRQFNRKDIPREDFTFINTAESEIAYLRGYRSPRKFESLKKPK